MGVGSPVSASRGDFLAPRRRSNSARGGTRVPKAALAPLAIAILALLVWSSRGGSRGAPIPSTVGRETRASAGVVRPRREQTLASADAGAVARTDGRGSFRPFERARRDGRTRAEDVDDGGSTTTAETQVERVRQIIDDSHLPSLPPLPPDAPLSPPEGWGDAFSAGDETGRAETETGSAGDAAKRVAGGEFVWSRPTRASRRTSSSGRRLSARAYASSAYLESIPPS